MASHLRLFVGTLLLCPIVWGTPVPITILHTNDIHGHAWPIARKDGVVRGGFAAQSALIEKVRAEVTKKNGIVLVLSAGDVNTGAPESDLLFAEPDFKAMSAIGYDAMVLGNHEFDGGLNKLVKQRPWIKFPVLSANVHNLTLTKNKLNEPSVIIEKNGIKIGVLGLTTDTLKKVILKSVAEVLDVENPVEVAKVQVPALKQSGADLVIVLSHVGISRSGTRTERVIENDEVKIAQEVPDIAVLIGGHSHTLLTDGMKVGETLLAQAGEKGEYLGRVDLLWDPENKKVIERKAKALPILPTQGEDAKLKKQLRQYEKKVAGILDEVLGSTQNELDGERDNVRHQETNFGNFVCDVLRKVHKTDVAIFNGGGIRASIARGKIRLRDLLRAMPFRNTVTTGTLTGKQLKEALQTGLRYQQTGGSFLQVSGMRVRAKDNVLQSVTVNGAVVADAAQYKVASNNFLFGGGDHLDVLTEATDIQDTGVPIDELLSKYIRAHPIVYSKVDKRIVLE